jgi:hypothetical protein
MNIAKPFIDSWNIMIKNLGIILISLIIILIMTIVTLGVMYLPLMIGLQMLFVKAARGKAIASNEIFDPMKRYFSLVFGNLGILLLIVFGLLLLVVPGLAWASWWMYALLFMVDKNLHIEAGMKASKELVRKNGTWWHLLFLLVAYVIDNILVWIIGPFGLLLKFITTPLTMGAIACAYVEESAK